MAAIAVLASGCATSHEAGAVSDIDAGPESFSAVCKMFCTMAEDCEWFRPIEECVALCNQENKGVRPWLECVLAEATCAPNEAACDYSIRLLDRHVYQRIED